MIVNDQSEEYTIGWIKLYRSLKKHWLWPSKRPMTDFEAWVVILMETNHNKEKVRIGDKLLDCDRGEKLYSLKTWANIFRWDKSKTRRFFNLLEKDNMIVLKSERITTRLTVCNYGLYQDVRNADETQVTRRRHGGDTAETPTKEVKKDKKEKKSNSDPYFLKLIPDFLREDSFIKVWKIWVEFRNEKKKPLSERAVNIQMNKLKNHHDPVEVINYSIMNDYQGLFPENVRESKDSKSENGPPIEIEEEFR